MKASDGSDGLPDLSIYSDDGWGVFFEMKVQSQLTADQLNRHAKTVDRYGFERPLFVAVTVEAINSKMPKGIILIQWRQLYAWFAQRTADSLWVLEFVRYMEVFEEQSIDSGYQVRGTITMFNGLRFDDEQPFHYREAKRLIRLLGDDLQSREELESRLGVDPLAGRRPAITNEGSVWDFIPLKAARGADFIRYPHLTLSLRPESAVAAITIPHRVSGGFRTRLRKLGEQGFLELMARLEEQLRPAIKRSTGAKSAFYAMQRHYKSQRSKPTVDGRIMADLRTCVASSTSDVKYQPEWMNAIYNVLTRKQSNIQCGIEVQFDYGCSIIRSPGAVELFVQSWLATRPLLELVLSSDDQHGARFQG